MTMRDLKELSNFCRSHHDTEKILCTIVAKKGSAYRGPGAKKIILSNGEACGYLSGGCLEGDIVSVALARRDKLPHLQSFSTMSEEDRLMGYQTGCSGVITILFENLPVDGDISRYIPYGPRTGIAGIAISLKPENLGERTILQQLPASAAEDCFVDPWIDPINLYVIGCGANARPFADLAPPLGWDVTFLDYRQGNTVPETPDVASRIVPLGQIGAFIPEGVNSYVVVMTHNYEADMDIVRQLHKRTYGYIGCVGPLKRFEQIQQDLKKLAGFNVDPRWASSVYAPAGLKQGRSPEDIAFSIIAEIRFGRAA